MSDATARIKVDLEVLLGTINTTVQKGMKDIAVRLEHQAEAGFQALSQKIPRGSIGNPSAQQLSRMDGLNRLMKQFLRYAIGYAVLYKAAQAVSALTKGLLDLDEALFDIKAVAAATTDQMELMEASIKRVATTTKFTIQEIAQAGKVLAQTGLRGSDFSSALDATARFASAVGASINLAADLVSTMRQVFSEMSDASISNLLTKAINISKLNASDLKTILSLSTQTAKAYGLSAEQLLSVASTLRNAGIKASTVATGFRQALIEMFTLDSSAVKVITRRYREIGEGMSDEMVRAKFFSFTKANNPLVAVLEELKRLGFSGGARQQFSRAFDVRAVNAILPLIDRLDELRTSEVKLAFGNAAINASRTQMESFNNTMKNLGATIGAFTDDILGGLIPGLTGMAQGLTNVVQLMREWNLETKAALGSGGEVTAAGGLSGAIAGGILGKGAAGKVIAALAGGAAGVLGGTAGVPLAAKMGIDSITLQRAVAGLGGIMLAIAAIKPVLALFAKNSPSKRVARVLSAGKGGLLAKSISVKGILKGLGRLTLWVGLVLSVIEVLNLTFDFFSGPEAGTAMKKLEAQRALLQYRISQAEDAYKEFEAFEIGGDTSTMGGQVTAIKGKLNQGKLASRALFGKDSLSENTLVLLELLTSIGAEAGSASQKRMLKQLEKEFGMTTDLAPKAILRLANTIVDGTAAAAAAADSMNTQIENIQNMEESKRSPAQKALLDSYYAMAEGDKKIYLALSNSAADAVDRIEVVARILDAASAIGKESKEQLLRRAKIAMSKILVNSQTEILELGEEDSEAQKNAITNIADNFVRAKAALNIPRKESLSAWADAMEGIVSLTKGLVLDAERALADVEAARGAPGTTRRLGEAKTAIERAKALTGNIRASGEGAREEVVAEEAEQSRLDKKTTGQLTAIFNNMRDVLLAPSTKVVLERAGEGAQYEAGIKAIEGGANIVRNEEGVLELSEAQQELAKTLEVVNQLTLGEVAAIDEKLRTYEAEKELLVQKMDSDYRLAQLRRKEGGLAAQGNESREELNKNFAIQLALIEAEVVYHKDLLGQAVTDDKQRKQINKKLFLLGMKRVTKVREQLAIDTKLEIDARKFLDNNAKQWRDRQKRSIGLNTASRKNLQAFNTAPQTARGEALSTAQKIEALDIQINDLWNRLDLNKEFSRITPLTEAGRVRQEDAKKEVEEINAKLAEAYNKLNQLRLDVGEAVVQGTNFQSLLNDLNATEYATQNLGKTIRGSLVDGFNAVGDAITDMAFEGTSAIEAMTASVKGLLRELANIFVKQQMLELLNSFNKGITPTATASTATAGGNYVLNPYAKPPGYATGAIITGRGTSTSDSMVGRLSVGEGILNAKAVGDLGRSFVHAANARAFKAASGGISFENSKTRGGKNPFKPTVNISVESPPGVPLQAEVVRQNNEVMIKLLAKQVEGQIASGVARGDGALNQALEGIGVGRARSLVR